MRCQFLRSAAAVTALTLLALAAPSLTEAADPQVFTDRVAFEAALSTLETETFTAPDTGFENHTSATFDFVTLTGSDQGYFQIVGNSLRSEVAADTGSPFGGDVLLTFPTPVFGFGGDFIGANTGRGLQIDVGGIASYFFGDFHAEPGTGFFGVITSTPFTTVRFSAGGFMSNIGTEIFVLDNVSFSTVDPVAPTITISADQTRLWPPSGKLVPVTVTGQITDGAGGLGVDPDSVTFAVQDEYGQVEPSGPVTLNQDGTYSFIVALLASRLDTDTDGRTYTISVTASDQGGNQAVESVTVVVPRSQGKR